MILNRGRRIRRCGVLAACALFGAALLVVVPVCLTLAQGTAKKKPAPTAPAAKKPDLAADINDAIRTIEARDFRKFLDLYAPTQVLREIRQADRVDEIVEQLADDRDLSARLLEALKIMQKLKPQYDKSGGLATFEADLTEIAGAETATEIVVPSGKDLKLPGLGDDLPAALKQAAKLLEAGDLATFVESFFPVAEVARLRANDQLAALIQQFKDTPELSESMLADLDQLRSLKPDLSDEGRTAVYQPPKAEEGQIRKIRLQRVTGGWRLFDDTPRVATELKGQSKLKARGAVVQMQMELIGGNWRLVAFP